MKIPSEKFTWVATHKELVKIISSKRNQQTYLIDLLKQLEIAGLHDEAKPGKRIDLEEIDPFSFFCFIYKHGPEKRLRLLQSLARLLKISIPSDDLGIPSVNAQKVCLFPFKHERKNNEINRLWDFFEAALKNKITDEQFADVLQILGTGKTKLTEGLYNILPDKYFPINGPAKPYIKEVLGIEPVFNTYTEYLSLLEKIKSKITIPFYELSYEAWKWNDEQSRNISINTEIKQLNDMKNYWLFAPGKGASKWDEQYAEGIMAIGWGKLGDLSKYKSRVALKKALNTIYPTKPNSSRMNDVSATDDFINKMKIGDIVIVKKGKREYAGYGIVTSEYYYDQSKVEFNHLRKVNWIKKGIWKETVHDIVLKTLTDITKFSNYVNRLVELIGITDEHHNQETLNLPLALNTILYGPPGTGKTFALKNEYMKYFTASENAVTKEEYLSDIIQHCSWWQVIALALRQLRNAKVADIANHEYLIIKSRFSNSKTVTQTIWGQLLSHTIEDSQTVNVTKRQPPLIFNKTTNSIWEILDDEIMDQAPEIIELEKKISEYSLTSDKKIKRYEFVTFHQSYSYEDFIEGIKPELNETDVAYKIEEGVFQKLCNRARNDERNKYAIFIDEINRGNISSIFGEMITLIEDDKREGASNEVKATLPYSQTPFAVPANLYIIGTMNTADRSVEALDTALRRRFSFLELNPEPEKLSQTDYACQGIDLTKLLSAINSRIEKLLDKDYCIGHSYFMNIKDRNNPINELRFIFQNKILPLLQEYFYGDWGKIMLVLGEGFVTKSKSTVTFLSKEKYENYEEFEEKPIYKFTASNTWTLDTFRLIYE